MAAITYDKRTKAQGNICNRTDMKETHEFYKFLFFPITVCMPNGLCLRVDPTIPRSGVATSRVLGLGHGEMCQTRVVAVLGVGVHPCTV